MLNLLAESLNAFDFGSIFGNIVSEWYYYLALLVVVAAMVVFFAVKKPAKINGLSETQKIVYIAMLTAISTVLNYFTFYPASYIAVSFTATVCFVAGITLGANAGFAVGFIGDLIGAIIFPAGPYNPLIGLASGLMGFIPGIIFQYFKGNLYLKTVISAVLCLLICTSGINTFALWLMYGLGKKTFWAYLIVRLPWQALIATANCVLCIGIMGALKRISLTKFYLFKDNKRDGQVKSKEPEGKEEK